MAFLFVSKLRVRTQIRSIEVIYLSAKAYHFLFLRPYSESVHITVFCLIGSSYTYFWCAPREEGDCAAK